MHRMTLAAHLFPSLRSRYHATDVPGLQSTAAAQPTDRAGE